MPKIIWETKKFRLAFYSQFGFNLQVWSKYRKTFVTTNQWSEKASSFKKENKQ